MVEVVKMGKNIVNLFLFFVLSLSSPCMALDLKTQNKELKEEIIIHNLISGLYLSSDQMEFILKKAKELGTLRDRLKEEADSISKEEEVSFLLLREEVKKEAPSVSGYLADKIRKNTAFVQTLRKEYLKALDKATQEVKENLNDSQLYNLENFKPCLIPPKGNARIGQDNEAVHMARMLEHIRSLPFSGYERRKEVVVDRYIKAISLIVPSLDQQDLLEARTKLLEILEEARDLSEVDFAIQKNDLAEKIKNIVVSDERIDLDKRIARFLLSPQIVNILEEKIYDQSL